MALLALPPPPAPVIWLFPDPVRLRSTDWEGDKGAVLRNAFEARRHWSALSGARSGDSVVESDPFEYRSVPLETAFKVRVRYKLVGNLKPIPYRLDE